MIRTEVLSACAKVFETEKFTLLTPKYATLGDYAVNILQLGEKPQSERVSQWVDHLRTQELFEKVTLDGAFINMFVSKAALLQEMNTLLNDPEAYGSSSWGAGQTWLIEHTSPNPNKAMHVGHLRNNVTGMAIARIAAYAGVTVQTDCVDNNRGISIAKLMWGYLAFAHTKHSEESTDINYWFDHQDEYETPESAKTSPSRFVDALYVKASEAYESDEHIQKTIKGMVVSWENGDEKVRALWRKVLDMSHAGQHITLKRLGNHWDTVWHEDEHYQAGKAYVEKGLKDGIFITSDEGTVITQLEKDFKLPDTVVLKSDGTSLYITQDIALTDLKINKFHPDRLMWVIGPDQSLALQQMFAVCDQLGIMKYDQGIHITYGYMSIKGQGKMSSRKGNVVYIDDLLDEAVAKAHSLIKHPEDIADIDATSEKVGVGAVKYSLLRVGRSQDMVFDFDESLSFEGNSGPYLQYAYARLMSILKKAGNQPDTTHITSDADLTDDDTQIMRTLSRFPAVVLESASSYNPHLIATYVFDVAQQFNAFYEHQPVLKADEPLRTFRLSLVLATATVIKNSLGLLGIEVLDRL